MKVQFEQDGATLISSDGQETIRWDVATGARKDKVAGQFAFAKATNERYIVTHKDDLIFVYTRGGVVNKYQVVFQGHGVTPVGSLRKGELPGHLVFARTRGHIPPDCLWAV